MKPKRKPNRMKKYCSLLLCLCLCANPVIFPKKTAGAADLPVQKLLLESFEDTLSLSVPEGSVTEFEGNRVLALSDTLTGTLYTPPTKQYRISGSFRVNGLSGNRSYLEVIPRRRTAPENYFGGERGIPFALDLQKQYLRIGAQEGPDLSVPSGIWHTFSVAVLDNLGIFSVNGVTMCAEIPSWSGGFALRAEGAEILFDDIRVEKILANTSATASPVSLKPLVDALHISPYEAVSYVSAAGIVAEYADGTVSAVTPDSVSISGSAVTELSKGFARFASSGTYTVGVDALHAPLSVTVDSEGMTEEEYLANTLYKRRDNALYHGASAWLSGISESIAGTAHLLYMTAPISLYPRSQNWDSAVSFLYSLIQDTKPAERGTGAEDFIVLALLHCCYLPPSVNISEAVKAPLTNYLKKLDYSNPSEVLSENHRITYYAAANLAFSLWPDNVWYNGLSTAQNKIRYRDYITQWAERRLKFGMGEYDSSYYGVDLAALESLYTWSDDYTVKKTAYEMLCYLYTDLCEDSGGSLIGGPQSRIYFNTEESKKLSVLDMVFDAKITPGAEVYLQMLPLLDSAFLPPEGLFTLMRDPNKRHVSIERRKIYELPDDAAITDSIVKYTYVTPNYTVGSLVRQDNILEKATLRGDKYYISTGTYQNPTRVAPNFSDISFAASIGNDPLCTITESHPGAAGYTDTKSAHAYFAGDHGCGCSAYTQHENTVLGMRDIQKADTADFTHFWINRNAFETVEEEDGWIFLSHKGVFAALRPLKDNQLSGQKAYEWGSADEMYVGLPLSQTEVKVKSRQTAFVMELADKLDFPGNFDEFKARMKQNTISYSGDVLSYTNLKGHTLTLNGKTGAQTLDDQPVSYEDSNTEQSPFLNAQWGSTTKTYTCYASRFSTPQDCYLSAVRTGKDTIRLDAAADTAAVYAALYDKDGILLTTLQLGSTSGTELNLAALPGCSAVKLFAFDSPDTLRPLTRALKVPV